jgi:hypothetical protein
MVNEESFGKPKDFSCEKRIVFSFSFGESDENRKKLLIFLAK